MVKLCLYRKYNLIILFEEVNEMLDAELVGRVIQQKREEKHLTQEVVSGFADIGRAHLSAIERGARRPTLDTFYKIAIALDMSPGVLMTEIENEIKKAEG